MLDGLEPQGPRLMVDDLDRRLPVLAALPGDEKQGPRQELNRRNNFPLNQEARLWHRRVVQRDSDFALECPAQFRSVQPDAKPSSVPGSICAGCVQASRSSQLDLKNPQWGGPLISDYELVLNDCALLWGAKGKAEIWEDRSRRVGWQGNGRGTSNRRRNAARRKNLICEQPLVARRPGGPPPPGVTCDGVGYLVRVESQLHQAQAVVIIVPEVLVELGSKRFATSVTKLGTPSTMIGT